MRITLSAAAIVAALALAADGLTAAPQGKTSSSAPAAASAHPATVQQLMRGTLFPSSNVVFSAQGDDPAKVPHDAQPSASTDPLRSVFGGWEAVANAALALTESAALFEIDRKCSNGLPAPIRGDKWKRSLSDMRAAGLAAFKAAEARDQDAVLEVSEKLAASCSACHDAYRGAKRCVE